MNTKKVPQKAAKSTTTRDSVEQTIRSGVLGETGREVGAVYDGESPSEAIRRQASWLMLHVHQMDQDIIGGDPAEVVITAERNFRHACEMLMLISLAVEEIEHEYFVAKAVGAA